MLTPIATVEEQLRIINECRQSGLTANEWCQRHGVRWNTYHTWVTRLKKKGLLETAATVPTVVINEPMQALYDSFGEVKLSFKASIKWK